MATVPAKSGVEENDEHHRLTAVQGLAALSLDALSSVAYGPEAILVVLVAAGATALHYSVPITGAIVVLLAVLVVSYRQVIAAFPNGGGAYAVSKAHLGTQASLVAAASLIVDYVLNAAVGVSAGIEALYSTFPVLYGARVWLCLAVLALITGLNLWGVSESAKVFTVPTLLFILSMAAVIVGGLIRTHPAVALNHQIGPSTEAIGILLLLKAFASGCSALTGVEAIANAVPEFRKPRARRAQHTEMWLGILLGTMLIGLGILIRKFHVVPHSNITVLAQLTEASLGHNFVYTAIGLITTVLLALAANTSFGGLPVLTALLAKDNFLPHMFGLRADRQVHRYGVVVLAVLAAALLVASNGDTQALIPLFAIGVFVGFTLSQFGMVKHWRIERSRGWMTRAAINGFGAVLTTVTTIIELGTKFTEGAWLIVLVIPGLVLLFRPGAPHLCPDRRAARDRPGAEAAVEAEVAGHRAGRQPVAAHGRGHLGGAVPRRRCDRGDRVLCRPGRRGGRRVVPPAMGGMEAERPADHAAQHAPLDRPSDRQVPLPDRGGGQIPPPGGADPRGAAQAVLVLPAVQPARRDPGPGDQAGHGQRGALPTPVPPGAVHGQRGRPRGRGPGPAARFRGSDARGPRRRWWQPRRWSRRRLGEVSGQLWSTGWLVASAAPT